MGESFRAVRLDDPLLRRTVEAVCLCGGMGLEVVCVPQRALDVYELSLGGVPISYTRRDRGISPENFTEDGAEGFLRNFFAGFTTTCGLIQSGRPCEEAGRRFGLHGCVSNTPAHDLCLTHADGCVKVSGVVDEVHPEGEHMRMVRTVTVYGDEARVELRDRVTNLGDETVPFMMMYHMNFGAPFLGPDLRIDARLLYAQDRDSGMQEAQETVLSAGKPCSMQQEKVYYTRPDWRQGVTLQSPACGIACHLEARGEGLDWMGVWKDFTSGAYALGIEPCNCPGLGRARAREQGLLPMLRSGESRTHTITATFHQLKEVDHLAGYHDDV